MRNTGTTSKFLRSAANILFALGFLQGAYLIVVALVVMVRPASSSYSNPWLLLPWLSVLAFLLAGVACRRLARNTGN